MSKDYSSIIDEVYRESEEAQAQMRQAQYKASLMTSLPVSPEQATKQYQLSKQTGIPVGIVRAKENEIAQRTELATFEDFDFVNNFPKVVAQLSRPEVAGAIKDDINSLSTFEKISRSTQEKFQQSALQDETVDLRIKRLFPNEKLAPREQALIAEFERSQPRDYGLGYAGIIAPETAGAARTFYGVAKEAGPRALAVGGVGAVVGGIATKTPAGAAAGFRTALGLAVPVSSAMSMAKLEAAGAGDELRNVVDESGKPLESEVVLGAALLTGAINGAIETIPVKIGLDTVKKAFSREGIKQLVKSPIAREYLKNIGKGAAIEGSTEALQSLVGIIIGEGAKMKSDGEYKPFGMKDLNDTEGFQKFFSERVAPEVKQSFISGSAGGAGISAVGGTVIATKRIYDNKKANEREQEAITQIIDTSKQSKVLQRDSALFKDVTESTLGETNIYIPAEQIQTYFQEKPDQAASFFKNIPDAQEQIQEALDTGGNLVIKGNDLATAIKENPELETLKEFMKLSPESFNALEAQDEFLTRVVPEQVAMEEEAISNAERDAIKRNIRQQISNVIPTKEQEDYIKLLESYYDTRAKKYGSEAAKKILETYLGQLEIGQKKFQKPSPFKMVEDLDLMIDKARKPIKQPKATKPLLRTLKEMGGVRIGSNLAGELNAMGVTSKTAPTLFRKETGLGDIDNIPLSEFQTKFPNVQAIADKTGNYVDRNYLLNLLSEEQFGKDITQVKTPEQEQIDNFLQGLDEAGIDLNASNEEIKKAIKEYQGRTFNQGLINPLLKPYQGMTKKEFLGEARRVGLEDSKFLTPKEHAANKDVKKEPFLDGKFQVKYGENNFEVFDGDKIIANYNYGDTLIVDKKYRRQGIAEELVYQWRLKNPDKPLAKTRNAKSEKLQEKVFNRIQNEINNTYFQTQDQTKTPAFKKWFGDSKVVDEKGEPLVVYHGSNSKFDTFDTKKIGQTATAEGYGFYLTDNKEIAKGYQRDGGSLIEAYLSMQKPLDSKRKPFNAKEISQVLNKMVDIEIKKFSGEIADYKDSFLSNFVDTYSLSKAQAIKETAQLIVEGNETAIDQISELSNVVGDKTTVPEAVRDALGFDGVEVKDFQQGEGTVYLAWFPTQIKSVENKGTFDPESANIYYQSAPTFYSALEKQITDLPQGKGSPEQWAGIIKNLTQKGVKQEELDWTGIEDWIKEQKGSVTKEQILDYLKANKIEVEEVVKGDNISKKGYVIIDPNSGGRLSEEVFSTEQEAETAARKSGFFFEIQNADQQTGISTTKFSKYTLAGGENYRELLLTLPNAKANKLNARRREIEELGANATEEQKKEWASIMNQLQPDDRDIEGNSRFKNFPEYRSSHYDEQNILAHIRFNERTDKDGARVMFVEELQSDWHQEGRKKGYKGGENEKEALRLRDAYAKMGEELAQRTDELRKKLKTIDNLGFSSTPQALQAIRDHQDFAKRWDITEQDILEVANEYRRLYTELVNLELNPNFNSTQGVPNAPFKTTWNELAFKRALMWAVENNFDKVAWTTGEQQAERYDLSKQVKSVEWKFSDDDKDGVLLVYDLNDRLVLEKDINEKNLEDYVGKDVAKKLIDQQASEPNNIGVKTKTLSDSGLKVGGEGMKAFYDKIVPTMVNKLVKKFGGKVEAIELGNNSTPSKNQNKILTFRDWVWGNINNDYSFDDAQKDINNNSELYKKYLSDTGKLQHAVEITPAMRESIQKQGLPLFQNESSPKGQTQFIGQKPVITLFEKADRSTLLHELGHTFLQIEADVAKLPDMPADFKKDWATLEKWLGVKDGVITREAHEKFARGFEAYVREGKAPSLELRSAFRRFKAWLVKVYQDVLNLNVKLNDDIRDYFDRLLATDEAIETQRNNPIFATDKNVLELLTKKEREDYIKISDNAKEKTKEQLLKKAFKQSELKNKKSYKEALEEVKQEIQDELNQDKTFKVLNYLKTGKLNGEEQPKKIKLSRQDVKENYDGEFIKYLPKEIFGKDGVEVALVADEFGFKSGSEMLYSIANAPDYKARVEELASQEMIRRYGDMLKDGTIEREALEMAENEARANKIVYELNAINRKVRTITETKDAYKQKAKEIIEGKGIVEATDTNKYYINELKAAREAGKALGKKDYEKAVDWKKKQLLNHFLFRESKALRDEIKASKKRYDRYKKKPAKGKVIIDEDYRLRISNLLQDFGLTNKGIDYVQTNIQELDAWKRGKQEEGVLGLIEFPEIADFQGKSFNQLTVEEYRTLDNAIENLAHIGRQERSIIVDGVKKSIDEFVDSVQENLNKLPDKQVKIGELSKKEKYKKFFDSAVTFLDKVQTTVFKIDDKKELGVFYQGFVKGLTEGVRNKDNLSRESYAKLDEIFKKHYKKGVIPSKETYFETLNQSLTKNSVIALALNWGNETNRKRIKDGYKWTDQQVNEILTTLDKNDLAFVQDIWDFINSYWPSLESIDKKIYGIAPKKEAASPITVKTNEGDVNLRGGYYPISYTEDTDFLETTAKELNSFFVNNQGSNLNVNKSYSKERATGRVQGKVDLTLNPLFQHLEDVVNDIALKEPAWNAYKLVKNNKLKTQLKKKIGNADYQSLVSWVKDVYGRTSIQEGYLNKFARRARGATVMYQMGFKLSTVIIQATGLLNSTVKLGYGNMGYGIWKALGNGNPISINKAIREAEAKSKILKNRAKSFNRDVSEIMQRMEKSKGIMPDVAKYAFLAITKAQKMVDVPTWYGAYYKGFKEFKDDAKAVEYADKILESTQGTSHKYALSSIERNESGFARIMTTFYSYMNVKFNLLRQSYIGTDFKKPRDIAKFTSDMTLLFIADAIATEFLRQGISEALKDGDDEEEKKSALKYANLVGQSVTSTVPGVREIYNSAIGYSAMPAGLGILDIAGKKGIGVIGKEILKEDEVDWINVLRGVNNTSAVFSMGGGAQIDIFLKALQDQQEGEEVAPIDFLLKSKK